MVERERRSVLLTCEHPNYQNTPKKRPFLGENKAPINSSIFKPRIGVCLQDKIAKSFKLLVILTEIHSNSNTNNV